MQSRKDYFARKSASNVRKLLDLEQEIERIQGMEANDGWLSLIKKLITQQKNEGGLKADF